MTLLRNKFRALLNEEQLLKFDSRIGKRGFGESGEFHGNRMNRKDAPRNRRGA